MISRLALRSPSRRGFTLIELAIVLSIAGLLFIGLWRLFSGGNQQLRDQSAASQHAQLVAAIKGYLTSAEGSNFMATNNATANAVSLPLPTTNTSNANCKTVGLVSNPGLCDFLPPGFTTATVNSYGQTFAVRVAGDGRGAGVQPNTYSFMLMTSGGTAIPDTSGGRIASLIGSDGGFIYSVNVCGTPVATTACGAYGAWSASVTGASPGYGFAAGASGTIASRSYISPEQSSQQVWLARPLINGTTAFNTMSTNLFLGGFNMYGASATGSTTGGGSIFMQAGNINLQGGSVLGTQGSIVSLVNTSSPVNPPINVTTGCTKSSPSDAACQWGFQLTGDGTVSNLFNVNALYANTFIYQSSDIRLKTDIRPLRDPLGDIMKLKPVSFTFKAGGQQSIGVIAQEVEKIYPQLVSEGRDGMKSVNYEGLIGPLIGAVQELKRENEKLREDLRTLHRHSAE